MQIARTCGLLSHRWLMAHQEQRIAGADPVLTEAAWRTIAIAVTDTLPTAFADQLRNLRREVEAAFPHARSFIRPGFDEPDR
jgi:hypothetical protein